MNGLSRQLKIYLALVILLGILCLVFVSFQTIYHYHSQHIEVQRDIAGRLWWIPVWLVILAISVFGPIEIPRTGVALSVESAVIISLILLFGPGVAAWFGVFSAIILDGLIRKVPLYKTAFNAAQLSLSFGVAGIVYHVTTGVTGGDYLVVAEVQPQKVILPLFASVITYFLINSLAVSLAVGLQERMSPIRVWKSHFRWTMFNNIALVTPLSFFMALICTELGDTLLGPFSVFFFLLPLVFLQYSVKLYFDLKEEHLSAIAALCSAQDASDRYTFGHSERVSKMSEKLAIQLKLPDKEVETIKHAGQLHDIGKIGIDYKVVQKAGPLNLKEWSEIKKHPAIGAQILRNLRFLKDATPYVELHHERLDGTGYPLGKKAAEIPLGARIIKVADAFDAMTSARPYRPAMSVSEALEQLFKDSGDQYDENVVNALSELITRGDIDIERHPEKHEVSHL